ncbi:MAG: hypothetical protein EBX37_01355 [Alphaproteobacteria bacterium]|nr:hypothetical protein [Alphaproteobacteria bacterium]
MDNSTATKPYSKLKGDPYRAYEALPIEVRRALQEALVDWCPLRAREWHLRLNCQFALVNRLLVLAVKMTSVLAPTVATPPASGRIHSCVFANFIAATLCRDGWYPRG